MVCLMVCKIWQQVAAVRIFLGAAEVPIHTASLYMTFWHPSEELAMKSSITYGTSTLAGAFNGLISSGLVKEYSHKDLFKMWQ